MKKPAKGRSISIQLSMRTFNDISELLAAQERSGRGTHRKLAAQVLRRLEKAPRARA